MKRIVSVFLPQWPIERLQRFAPERVPADRPFALVLSGRRGLALHAVNGRAFALGLKPGDRLADARARVPDLLSLPAEPAADRVALARLALWCGRYGAAVNIERVVAPEEKAACEHPCGLWIDSTGVAHLYGGEPALLAHLGHRLASLGLSARLGLASSHAAALALARFSPARFSSARFSSARFSSDSAPWAASALPDGARAALASLPVEGLALAPASTLLLRRLGLKRIGDLYAIPRASLERRFPSRAAAAAVLARLDLALGDAPEALAPMRPIETFSARRAFAEPLISQAGLSAAVAALADELCQGLEAKGRGVRRLLLSAYRTDASVLEVRAGTSAPVRARAHLLRLLEGRLAGLDAGFGIDALVLAAPRTEPLAAVQQGLRSACAGARCSPALLIDRLANRLGVDNVCGLAAAQSHIPERAGRLVPALAGQAATPRPAPQGPKPARPACAPSARKAHTVARPPLLFPAPEPIVVVAEIPDGPPARFIWRRVVRRVAAAEGPERIAPEWWREIGRTASRPRDYYRIEDEAGRRYWVFREGLYETRGEEDGDGGGPPRWYLHGLYG